MGAIPENDPAFLLKENVRILLTTLHSLQKKVVGFSWRKLFPFNLYFRAMDFPAYARFLEEIENGEHHAEAARLIGGRQEAGRRRAGPIAEPPIEPHSRLVAQADQRIAQDQVRKRDAGPVGAEPQAVPGPVVGEDEVPAIFQAAIGDDKMGRRNRKGVSRRASRRRHVEDVGVTADRRRPERRTFARRAERRTWESKDPNAGPSPPARQYRRGARRS